METKEDSVWLRNKQQTNREIQNSLQQEVVELQDKLQTQVSVRNELEKTASHKPSICNTLTDTSIPKDTEELVKKIAELELEVANLERYLLSLYRRFNQRVLSSSASDGLTNDHLITNKLPPPIDCGNNTFFDKSTPVVRNATLPENSTNQNPVKECEASQGPAILSDSSIHRCHSSMSQRSIESFRIKDSIGAVESFHSLPSSVLEIDAANEIGLDDQYGTSTYDHNIQETPNSLSEKMINCISAIYCELADPPLINPYYHSSIISMSSSADEYSCQNHDNKWSPQRANLSSISLSVDKPFPIRESQESSEPYCRLVKVEGICRDSEKLRDMQTKLDQYRSLVGSLEEVDPKKMRDEEKLAFWINVHNALIMHAYLVYGIPRSSKKRMSMILKAAYNVGGHSVNIDMIQSSILGCRLLRPGQWLQWRFPARAKLKIRDVRKAYSIDRSEPRLHFALCSGSYSDPAVRVYTPKSVYEDLEAAKEEFLQSTCIVHKEKKLLLPKLVESFAKDSDLCIARVIEMTEHLLRNSSKNIQHSQYRKIGKSIQWIPHNFKFRYLLSKDLVH